MGEQQWLKQTLASGVSMLILLRLRNSPPEDAIKATLEAWYQVLTYRRSWVQETDQKRLEKAFMVLASQCESFPSPKQLLEAMPQRMHNALPPPMISDEQRAKNAERLKQLLEMLRGSVKCMPKAENR